METHHLFTLFCVWMSPSSLEFYIADDYLSMDQPIRLWFAQTKAFNWAFSLLSSAKALSYPSILRCRNTDSPKSKIHFHKKVII